MNTSTARALDFEFPDSETKSLVLKQNGFQPLRISPERERKKELLMRPMNQLGLRNNFNHYFFDITKKEYLIDGTLRRMRQSDVLTLQEFIELNSDPQQMLITRRDGFAPKANSLYFKTTSSFKLFEFLREAGFTYLDWVILTPSGRQPFLENLSKEEILNLQAISLLGLYEDCSRAKKLREYFQKDTVTVRNLMSLSDNKASEMPMLMAVLQRMQRRLRRFGFRDADGPFMEASLDFPAYSGKCE